MSIVFVDFNSIAMMSIHSKNVQEFKDEPDNMFEVWKYTVFDRIFNFCFNKKRKTNEVIVAVDSSSWRKLAYKPYKGGRAKGRDDSTLDFEKYFEHFHAFHDEIKSKLPFKVIKCKYCEADDIISTLTLKCQNGNKCTIYANDSDYSTLINSNISVFTPAGNKEKEKKDPIKTLLVDSLNGRSKDNVSNCLIPESFDHDSEDKLRFGIKKAEKIITGGLDKWLSTQDFYVQQRFKTNKIILDNHNIPQSIQKSIINTYTNYKLPDPENIMKFFLERDWRFYKENINYIESQLLKLY